ncbi:MAG: ECF RNA polymerase sigma factor SigW [Parcubacteria group bacterium ADurb.Bin316]|nr:MAG: ECF RNA polymerase sigma factor SigW [Parcubacteria group bacterium ADurb.Bin316]HOZ56447.1 RNA polymerase sigma factor [bacterium]
MINNDQVEKMSDEDIVKLALQNQDYFLHIINRYQLRLFNFIRRITNASTEDAEDLLQEIFLKIYLNLNDFDRGLKFSSWAYAIARNQVISHHRKLQARAEGHTVALEDESVKQIAADFDIKNNIDLQCLRENIFKILDNLDDKYREVLVLKFLEEKSYQEISDIIKKPIGTVGSMMNKAKTEFQKELSRQKIKL